MKPFAKAAAILLCAVMLLTFSSCMQDASGDVPPGMKLATAAGDDFRLFVPTAWNSNTAYGISGAYFNMEDQSTVSVVKYPITTELAAQIDAAVLPEGDGAARLDWYWENACLVAVEAVALGGSLTRLDSETQGMVLDTLNARRYHVKATVQGETLHYVHVIAERESAFYVFSFTVLDSLYASLLPNVEAMLENFYFDEPYYPDEYVKPIEDGAEAPAGMKLASNEDVAYRFYVPVDWKIDRDQEIFAAYTEADGSNVSVVPYMPDEEGMSVADYFALCKEMMVNLAGEGKYQLFEEKAVTLGGRNATAYRYSFWVGDTEYHYLQVIAVYGSMVYSLTYTASPSCFDTHLEQVYDMIDAFAFR